jgi:nickel-dependent lactate racemase
MTTGRGSPGAVIGEREAEAICADYVAREGLSGRKVLAIIPDNTRTAPIGIFFRSLYRIFGGGPGRIDFLIALGTHPPMSAGEIGRRLGLAPGEGLGDFPRTAVFNHEWDNPARLRAAGTIPGDTIERMSGGLMGDPVTVTVNSLAYEYDALLIVGPVFPHEVVGFSGGNKYLVPGISGAEIIDMFHWLGALITNPVIIGRKRTPVREVVDAAAALIPVPRHCMSLVAGPGGTLAGLFCGAPEEAWEAAADLSASVHIVVKEKPFASVLSCAPAMYGDLWVGGKCAYKLEPVVRDGGELIIYAPHLHEVSVTHGPTIERIGYHVRDYFTSRPGMFSDVPGGILAHSTHVKGVGTYADGTERPRINVTLATGIPEATCRRINLGYRDPVTIRPGEWEGREEEGILRVEKAGETLYRLRDDPFPAVGTAAHAGRTRHSMNNRIIP